MQPFVIVWHYAVAVLVQSVGLPKTAVQLLFRNLFLGVVMLCGQGIKFPLCKSRQCCAYYTPVTRALPIVIESIRIQLNPDQVLLQGSSSCERARSRLNSILVSQARSDRSGDTLVLAD